ncbi:L-seryl-tRNA(Sec) kinase [Scaptodrosophila lebanonensis]|uniref:L-seryl-tRNA(Sec) kinase n=1 Tax=Drosophila lebanonensis TaxID=7225 RepID=A0A6J2TE31_DROLE|nr:L-seryl-tRNA(Sec) kinase [Scaptodrosophila lebanonensis]
MLRISVICLIGLPAAGKTTLSYWLLQQQDAALKDYNILHLCYDDYHGEGAYKEQRLHILQLLEQLITTIKSKGKQSFEFPMRIRRRVSLNSSNYVIICDDNNYYRSMRYKLYQLCCFQDCNFAQIYISASLASCLERNAKRKDDVPVSVLQQMDKRLEPPRPIVNAWERNSLTLESIEATTDVIQFIISSFDKSPNASLKLVQVKAPQIQTVAHKLDLMLRARIKEKLQLQDAETKQIQGQRLNNKRKQILAQFKANKQTDNDHVDLEYFVSGLT